MHHSAVCSLDAITDGSKHIHLSLITSYSWCGNETGKNIGVTALIKIVHHPRRGHSAGRSRQVPRTTPNGSCIRSRTDPCSICSSKYAPGWAPLGGRVPDPVDVDVTLAQGILKADSVAVGTAAVGLDGVGSGKGGGAE
jgi:hypothetical protein